MSSLKLSARLDAVARHVPGIGGVADVGTDHGYIPAWLALNCHGGGLFATDIKKAPLLRAKETAVECGCLDKIEFYLCDGLSALDARNIATVIIAGMGGENIAQILGNARWTKENGRLLILQPMTKSPYLRKWLFDNGYAVLTEQLVDDGGIYEIMTAEAGTDAPYSPAELLMGHAGLISGDPLFEKRLESLIVKTRRVLTGLSVSKKPEDAGRLAETKKTLLSLLELKKAHIKG